MNITTNLVMFGISKVAIILYVLNNNCVANLEIFLFFSFYFYVDAKQNIRNQFTFHLQPRGILKMLPLGHH